jgi:nucleotide-binding universal stress UspA family protein
MLFRRIMFASDGSPASLKAAEAIARIAATNQETTVTVVVTLPKELDDEPESETDTALRNKVRQHAQRALSATGAVFQRWGIPHDDRLITGDCACTAVARAAKEDMCDLIAMNCTEHALTPDGKASNNLTAEVMQRAHVPVLVIPAQ